MAKGMMMTGWCVRALLENRKTQTMRLVPLDIANRFDVDHDGTVLSYEEPLYGVSCSPTFPAPHQPGDIVYVKEALRRLAVPEWPDEPMCAYAADGAEVWAELGYDDGPKMLPWKRGYGSPRFMPREAARLWRRILDVRAMRVQEITADEVQAEGVNVVAKLPAFPPPGTSAEQLEAVAKVIAHHLFAPLWNDLHSKPGDRWADNPWVFRYTFEKVEADDAPGSR